MLSTILRVVIGSLALAGAAAIALALMLAWPVRPPPPLASIHAGAMQIDASGAPELRRFQARDGTWLAYRLYPAANGAKDRVAILAHGSSANSTEMHEVAAALAAGGVTAVAIDARGHGASGTRGDIAYPGQLDDDLADLLAEFRKLNPSARFALIGHSAGGGFALRIAASPLGGAFDRFILLAPYLGYSAPTNRPAEGKGLWASPDLPRIIATLVVARRDRLAAVAARDRLRQRARGEAVRDKRLLLPPVAELYRAAGLEGRLRARQGPDFSRRRRRRRTHGRARL